MVRFTLLIVSMDVSTRRIVPTIGMLSNWPSV